MTSWRPLSRDQITVADIFAAALHGLDQETDAEKRAKYMEFIDIYSRLDDNEHALFIRRYPQEGKAMLTFRERGRLEGEASLLLRLLERRFGSLSEQLTERVQKSSSAELKRWADNILDARTLDEVFGEH